MITITSQLFTMDRSFKDEKESRELSVWNHVAWKKKKELDIILEHRRCPNSDHWNIINEVQVIAHQDGVEFKTNLCCEEFENEIKVHLKI